MTDIHLAAWLECLQDTAQSAPNSKQSTDRFCCDFAVWESAADKFVQETANQNTVTQDAPPTGTEVEGNSGIVANLPLPITKRTPHQSETAVNLLMFHEKNNFQVIKMLQTAVCVCVCVCVCDRVPECLYK